MYKSYPHTTHDTCRASCVDTIYTLTPPPHGVDYYTNSSHFPAYKKAASLSVFIWLIHSNSYGSIYKQTVHQLDNCYNYLLKPLLLYSTENYVTLDNVSSELLLIASGTTAKVSNKQLIAPLTTDQHLVTRRRRFLIQAKHPQLKHLVKEQTSSTAQVCLIVMLMDMEAISLVMIVRSLVHVYRRSIYGHINVPIVINSSMSHQKMEIEYLLLEVLKGLNGTEFR